VVRHYLVGKTWTENKNVSVETTQNGEMSQDGASNDLERHVKTTGVIH